jgi:hypothetical protein
MTAVEQLISKSQEILCCHHDGDGPIDELVTLMNEIVPDSLQPSDKLSGSSMDGWHKYDLCTTSYFSLSVFTIAQGHVIPFHGHPQMRVLMRALHGHLRVLAYDWARQYPWGGLARHTYDLVLSSDNDTLIVEPNRGNIHQVIANSDCSFLDLTFPPYPDQERDCFRYYRIAAEELVNGERLAKLVIM